MTMGYTCGYHDGTEPAVTLLTSLTSGNTLASCAQCQPIMLVGQLAAGLGVPVDGLYAAVERYVKKAAREAQQAADAGVPAGTGLQAAECPFCHQDVTATEAEMAAAQAEHAAKCEATAAAAKGGDGS